MTSAFFFASSTTIQSTTEIRGQEEMLAKCRVQDSLVCSEEVALSQQRNWGSERGSLQGQQ